MIDYAKSMNTHTHSRSTLIQSFIPAISIAPFKSSTTQRRSQLQHGYCIVVSRRSTQATAGKELDQGPYVTARAGVEPMILRLKVIDSTKAPPRPTVMADLVDSFCCNFSLECSKGV